VEVDRWRKRFVGELKDRPEGFSATASGLSPAGRMWR
jgi:hypothetical protein